MIQEEIAKFWQKPFAFLSLPDIIEI